MKAKDPCKESCITICNQWAWKPDDALKSLKECIRMLVRTASGNGNLLLNVGPMMDGRMEKLRQVSRLKEIGLWLKKYGESIYDTKGGPYPPNEMFTTTRKGNKIYLHILQGKPGQLVLPALPGAMITAAYFMGGDKLPFTQEAGKGYHLLTLPAVMPDENCSVVVVEFNSNAEELPVVQNPQTLYDTLNIVITDTRSSPAQGRAGSDAIHRDPVYSYAVTRQYDDSGHVGTGLAFTLGEGNDMVCNAAKFYAEKLKGWDIEELMAGFGNIFNLLSNEQQFRWLGPHKGVVHLGLASVTINACF